MARLWRCSSKSVGDNCNIQQGVQVEKQRHFDFGCPGMSSCFEANGTHPARHKSHVEKPTGQGSREARIWHVMQRDVQRRIWHIVDDHMWFLCAQRLRKSTEILGLLGCLSLMKIYEVQRQTCCFMMFPKMLATVYCSPSLVFDENRNAGKWSFGLRELFLLRERESWRVCPGLSIPTSHQSKCQKGIVDDCWWTRFSLIQGVCFPRVFDPYCYLNELPNRLRHQSLTAWAKMKQTAPHARKFNEWKWLPSKFGWVDQ